MDLASLRLKKNEERRLQSGHLWIYSNEIDTKTSPLNQYVAGEVVKVQAYDKSFLGLAYVNPQSLITGRLIARTAQDNFSLDFFQRRLQNALALRERCYTTPYYRLVFAESDNLPGLVIDRYGNHVVMQLNTAGMAAQEALIIAALQTLLPELKSIVLRNDSAVRLQEGLTTAVSVAFGEPPEHLEIVENATHFQAPLLTGQKTGWFYDHRLNRARVSAYAPGARVLDVFSYLGAFGIQAAKAGASAVVCIDASASAAQFIQQNAALNHLESKVEVICDDAFDALKHLAQAQTTFDVILLDPPAFVKKLKDKKAGLIAYQRLQEAAFKILSPGGLLFSCSCSMHVSYAELLNTLRRAALATHCQAQVIERGHQGADHPVHLAIPETDYLKMIAVRKG